MAAKTHSIFDPAIIVPAIGESFKKLNPVTMLKNPVMFVTEVGAIITTILMFTGSQGAPFGFLLQITLWLWFTVLFANFAEAMAEGRGKAQADSLRKARTQTFANRIQGGTIEKVASERLRKGDLVVVKAGELIPGDGEIIEGAATVDESAITGESAPVVREAGGDRSGVTGGTRVLSDEIKVRITSNPGETFLDRMIGLVEGTKRQKTPNEIALTILLSALTIIFLVVLITRSAVIFNAIIIVLLIPLALKGGEIPPTWRREDPAAQPAHLRFGRHHRAIHRH
jgi:K+-transporting ATPase ATPase B chain